MYDHLQELQDLYEKLTAPGRRGAMREVGLKAGCKTKNDPTRVFKHLMKSKYTKSCIAAAKEVIAAYEEKEKVLLTRSANPDRTQKGVKRVLAV